MSSSQNEANRLRQEARVLEAKAAQIDAQGGTPEASCGCKIATSVARTVVLVGLSAALGVPLGS